MPIVEHAFDWSKLAELLPQLGKEYAKLAARYRAVLHIIALLPPLLIPLEAAKWFSKNPAVIGGFIACYVLLAIVLFYFTGRWIGNVRSFGLQRIEEDRLCSRTLVRIEKDAGLSGEMSFEEIYLTDGSGLERRTRKQIIYAENDIEINMDRGQKLFANSNVPLMINTAIVALYCIYAVVGGFLLPHEEAVGVNALMYLQYILLVCMPFATYIIQNSFRQHLLNEVIAETLLLYITDDDAREVMDAAGAPQAAGEEPEEQAAGEAAEAEFSEDSNEGGVQAEA